MNDIPSTSVRARLIEAALDCFLADEYENVTTRMIAERAEANVSMIRYYFGNKEGLFEEMIRETIAPLLDKLDSPMLSHLEGFASLLRLYYETVAARPEFPKLIIKILALNHGPGKRYVLRLIERGRLRGARRLEELKDKGAVAPHLNPDVVRMSFISLAMTPMLLRSIFEEQMGHPIDDAFLDQLATLNGHMLTLGLAMLDGQTTT